MHTWVLTLCYYKIINWLHARQKSNIAISSSRRRNYRRSIREHPRMLAVRLRTRRRHPRGRAGSRGWRTRRPGDDECWTRRPARSGDGSIAHDGSSVTGQWIWWSRECRLPRNRRRPHHLLPWIHPGWGTTQQSHNSLQWLLLLRGVISTFSWEEFFIFQCHLTIEKLEKQHFKFDIIHSSLDSFFFSFFSLFFSFLFFLSFFFLFFSFLGGGGGVGWRATALRPPQMTLLLLLLLLNIIASQTESCTSSSHPSSSNPILASCSSFRFFHWKITD